MDASDATYYTASFASLVGVIVAASTIDDLSFIFGIIAAWYEVLMDYIFPSIFILCALQLKGKNQ